MTSSLSAQGRTGSLEMFVGVVERVTAQERRLQDAVKEIASINSILVGFKTDMKSTSTPVESELPGRLVGMIHDLRRELYVEIDELKNGLSMRNAASVPAADKEESHTPGSMETLGTHEGKDSISEENVESPEHLIDVTAEQTKANVSGVHEQFREQQDLHSEMQRLSDQVRALQQQLAKIDISKEQEAKMQEAVAAPLEVQLESKREFPNVEPVQEDVPRTEARNKTILNQVLTSSDITRHYVWEHSVYDSIIFFNLRSVKHRSSALLFFGLLSNLILVVSTVICCSSEDFIANPFTEKNGFKHWRNTDAHSAFYVDDLGIQTLAYKVCSNDTTVQLSVASQQRAILMEVRRYSEGVTFAEISMGRLMCNVAVALWVCCCALELRTTLDFIMAVWAIPRAHRTTMSSDPQGLFFVAMSPVRYAMATLIGFIRGTIALVLAISGSTWLTYTTSIESLLLNASALGFVLEIDNTIFQLVAPYSAIALIGSLKPAIIGKGKLTTAVPYCMLFMVFSMLVALNVHLTRVYSDMMAVQDILCKPNQTLNYVIGTNPLGWATYAEITAKDAISLKYDALRDRSVNSVIRNHHNSDKLAMKMADWRELTDLNTYTHKEFIEKYECDDYNTLGLNTATVGSRIWASTGNDSFQHVSRCEDLKDFCFNTSYISIQVRFLCSDTCGCSNEYAGLWDLSYAYYGCPYRACHKKLETKLDALEFGCKDLNRTYLKKVGWNSMLRRMRRTSAITEEQNESLSTLGCDGLQYLQTTRLLAVCSMQEDRPSEPHGAAPFCPESCRCADAKSALASKTRCPGLCPRSCCE